MKVREISELNEWDSLKPKINSTMPRAKIANPMMLFMKKDPFNRRRIIGELTPIRGIIHPGPGETVRGGCLSNLSSGRAGA